MEDNGEHEILLPALSHIDETVEAWSTVSEDAFQGYLHARQKSYYGNPPTLRESLRSGENIRHAVIGIGASAVGALSAYFYIPGARKAVEVLVNDYGLSPEWLVQTLNVVLPASGASVNALLGAYCLINAANALLNPVSKDERYLKSSPDSKPWINYAKTAVKTVVAMTVTFGSIVPSFYITSSAGQIGMAFATSAANFPVNLVGVLNILSIKQRSTHRKVLLKYFNDQLEILRQAYIRNPEAVYKYILEKKEILSQISNKTERAEILFKQLVRIGNELIPSLDSKILKSETQSWPRFFTKVTLPVWTSLSDIGYIWDTYKTLTNIPLSVILTILSTLSLEGLSIYASLEVGEHILSGKTTVADAVMPKLSLVLNWVVAMVLAAPSGGTNFLVSTQFAQEFPLFKSLLSDEGKLVAERIGGIFGAVGAPIVNYYYASMLVKELIRLITHYLGDEQTEEFIDYMDMQQKMVNLYADMDDKQFDHLLIHWRTGNLNHPLHGCLSPILEDRLSKDFIMMEKRLENVRIRTMSTPDTYYEPTEVYNAVGMRHRRGFSFCT